MRVAGLLALVVMTVACDNTTYPGGGGGGGGGNVADFDGVMLYLEDNCTSCHFEGGQWPNYPSDLEADINDETGNLVVPGDPFASRLWQVLETPEEGPKPPPMPFGRTGPNDPATIQHIRLWIYDGAPL